MNNFFASKRLLWIFVALGAAAVIVALVGAIITKKNQTRKTADFQAAIKTQTVDVSQLPDAIFPADMPLEKGAKVTQNYTATTADGRFQATRVFETTRSLDDNLKLYQNFFRDSGWTILSTVNQTTLKAVLASKGNLKAQVNLSLNPSTNIKTIDITVTRVKD